MDSSYLIFIICVLSSSLDFMPCTTQTASFFLFRMRVDYHRIELGGTHWFIKCVAFGPRSAFLSSLKSRPVSSFSPSNLWLSQTATRYFFTLTLRWLHFLFYIVMCALVIVTAMVLRIAFPYVINALSHGSLSYTNFATFKGCYFHVYLFCRSTIVVPNFPQSFVYWRSASFHLMDVPLLYALRYPISHIPQLLLLLKDLAASVFRLSSTSPKSHPCCPLLWMLAPRSSHARHYSDALVDIMKCQSVPTLALLAAPFRDTLPRSRLVLHFNLLFPNSLRSRGVVGCLG
jgi:hypothetical protein